MPNPGGQATGELRGGTVYLTMSMAAAVALRRHIVAYLSLPEAPLLPPAEEDLLLAVYDVLSDVTELRAFFGKPPGSVDPDTLPESPF